jgi:hypothetical protein
MVDHKAAHEAEKETKEAPAVKEEAPPDTADTIVSRIEANVAKLHTATPSGIEAIQAEMTADLEKLRATAPPPVTQAAKASSHKAADDDDEEEEKHGRGKRK